MRDAGDEAKTWTQRGDEISLYDLKHLSWDVLAMLSVKLNLSAGSSAKGRHCLQYWHIADALIHKRLSSVCCSWEDLHLDVTQVVKDSDDI